MTTITAAVAGRGATAESVRPPRSESVCRRVLPLVALGVLAALGLGLALAATSGLRVTRFPDDHSAEVGFARDMMVHHAQAVEMAEIARDRTADPDLRLLATDVALTQQAQIGQILGWLDVWGLGPTGDEPAMAWMGHPTTGLMPGMASPEEVARLNEVPADEADASFLRLMIRHHQAGVDMARAALERTSRPEVRRLAASIVQGQASEIKAMEELLARRQRPPSDAGSPAPAGGGHHAPMPKP